MLGKLIKYDLKYIYKQLIVFYGIVLLSAIVARLTDFNSDTFIATFIHEFAQGCTFGFAFGTFINAGMRTWARFHMNHYGNESYLTHTLPIKRSTLWTSKFLSSLIVVLISTFVCIAAFLIMFFSSDFIRGWDLTNPEMLAFYGSFVLAFILQITYIIQSGLLGITLGHCHNYNRAVFSVIYGLAAYFIGSILLLAAVMLWAQFDHEIQSIIYNGSLPNVPSMIKLFLGFSLIYAGLIAITYFINRKILSRGVNVD